MSKIIDRPWAIIYGPKYSAVHGKGMMYGLGLTRTDAWENTILVMCGGRPSNFEMTKKGLRLKGMIAQRVEVRI